MDTHNIVEQLLHSVAKDPDMLKQFGVDPGAAIKGATGLDLSDKEIGDVVTVIEPLLEGKGLNMDAVIKLATEVLAGDPGALLEKLGGLFGGGDNSDDSKTEATEDSKASKTKKQDDGNEALDALGGIAEGILGNLLKGK